jgi:two-component system, OmpR family, sensor histidine kinase MprB
VSFRRRITLVSAAAVAVAVIIGSVLTYVLVRNQLRGQIDNSLKGFGTAIQDSARLFPGGQFTARVPPGDFIRRRDFLRGVPHGGTAPAGLSISGRQTAPAPKHIQPGPGGVVLTTRGNKLFKAPTTPPGANQPVIAVISAQAPPFYVGRDAPSRSVFPTDARAAKLAKSGGHPYFSEARIAGDHLRFYTVAIGKGHAVSIGRSLNEVDTVLGNVRWILLAIIVGGVAIAALLGRLVAGAALSPVRRLTETAEHVAETRDLAHRIATGTATGDELGRLAVSFNSMLDALERSMKALDQSARAQRQLVADASHELRTPVTSLRTNVEILQAAELPAAERERMVHDIVEQLEELTTLINDVIELARGDEPSHAREDVRLDEIVTAAIDRARLHAPSAQISAELEPTIVDGDPSRLDRAVRNLIDNAIKFSDAGAPIEVALRDGELTVRDHGPGIETGDLPHVFDRFYRGRKARALPGSGLGLAIVRQVAESHGGAVSAQLAAGGGTLMRLKLPITIVAPELAAAEAAVD